MADTPQTARDQVNNLVSSVKNDLGAYLAIMDRLEMAVAYFNALGGAPVVIANPPSGANAMATPTKFNNVITHVNAMITDLATRKAALLEILDGIPR